MNTELATYSENTLAAFEDAASSSGSQKPILRFSKGDWMVGQDEDVPLGTKLAADIINSEWGWIRWYDGKPEERLMVRIDSKRRPEPRSSLGYEDKALWKRDAGGQPQDPWQLTTEIPVRELEGERREFLLVGSSKGFVDARATLFKQFVEQGRVNFGKTPVIQLGSSKYKHKNAEYGMIKTPEMTIVSWFDPAAELPLAAPKKGKF